LRINHFITTISRGGAENQLLILVAEQVKLGHSVKVFPLKSSLDLELDFQKIGAEVDLQLYKKKLLTQVIKVRNMKFSDREIIHAHLPQAEIVAHFAKCRNKLSTRHYGGKFYPKFPKILSSWISRFLTRRKTVIAISQYVSEYLIMSKEVNSSIQIKTVKYGFNIKNFLGDSDDRLTRKVNPNILVCGTLARLSPEKNLETLIRGIYEFKRMDYQPVALYIFGEGPEKNKLTSLVEDLELTSEVTFYGKTNEPAKALLSLDLFILTSIFEGFGMVLLEAMATHRRIIASDIPTFKEILGADGAASFFEVGNPKDLAAEISKCVREASKDYYSLQEIQLSKYESSSMAQKISEVYLEVLGKNES